MQLPFYYPCQNFITRLSIVDQMSHENEPNKKSANYIGEPPNHLLYRLEENGKTLSIRWLYTRQSQKLFGSEFNRVLFFFGGGGGITQKIVLHTLLLPIRFAEFPLRNYFIEQCNYEDTWKSL